MKHRDNRCADLRFALVVTAPHLAAPVETSAPPAKRSDHDNLSVRAGEDTDFGDPGDEMEDEICV
jgi:hypothetical protein